MYSPLPDADSLAEWQAGTLRERDDVDFVELGCGGGQGTVGAAREGVGSAVGVDFSAQQLRHATRLRDLYGVEARFVAGDVTALPLADGAFDLAHSGYVFFMVEDVAAAFAEARRVLRTGGLFEFQIPHPFHELFDPATLELEHSYHASDPRREKFDDVLHEDMLVYDRGVGELHDALVDAGFAVKRVSETPQSDDPDDYDDDGSDSTSPELLAKVPRTLGFWAVAE